MIHHDQKQSNAENWEKYQPTIFYCDNTAYHDRWSQSQSLFI